MPCILRQVFVIEKTTDFPQILFSHSIYNIKNSFECLSFRCISKSVHSSGKLGRLLLLTSNSLLVPMPIVKNGLKRDFFNKSASSSARDARQYFTDSAFASLINSLPTRVCPMSIGPRRCRAIVPGSDPCLSHFDVFDDFVPHFSHVKATGKSAVFQRVPRVHLLPQRPRFSM